MPSKLNGVRVFVASPAGLQSERETFREEVHAFNEETAYVDGVCFIPVGWEQLPSGVGRPQAQINQDVRSCDFFLLLLWDRWGSPTGDPEGRFSSGAEEEYYVAAEALASPISPMRDISVMFKGVDARHLSDPGDQLRKVLAFRRQLEQEKSLLFTVFDSESEFRRELRKLLFRWTRANFDRPKDADRRVPAVSAGEEVTSTEAEPGGLQVALRLARAGRVSEAERQFSLILANTASSEAMAEYARFLRRSGRFSQARQVSERLLRQAERQLDVASMLQALALLGVISRKEGRVDEAVGHFERARALIPELDLTDPDISSRVCYALDNYGHSLRRRGDLDHALEVFSEAMTLRRSIHDDLGRAHSLNNLGIVQRERGLINEAKRSHEDALRTFTELGRLSDVHITESHLGSVWEELGDLNRAQQLYTAALTGARQSRNEDSISINLGKLARLFLKLGEPKRSLDYASECLEVNERSGNEEGAAMGLLLVGQCFAAMGDSGRANEFLEQALDRYSRIGHMNGRVQSLLELAIVQANMGQRTRANDLLTEAAIMVAAEPSPFLQRSLERARKEADSVM